jgi:hypothetical protein
MSGEFLNVWSETKHDIWERLANVDNAPNDLYCELYRSIAKSLKRPENALELVAWKAKFEEVLTDAELSKKTFYEIDTEDLNGERALCVFFEDVFETLDELNGDALKEPYAEILNEFIAKYSLRYQVLASCKIVPTLGGIFSSLVLDFAKYANGDEHLADLLAAFQSSIQELHGGISEERIKTCIQRQMNLLEGIAKTSPNVSKGDLSGMCSQISSWPHSQIKAAITNLYTFACDYPGIRHGGRYESKLRPMDARDLVALSVVLTGFIPYLTDNVDPTAVFWRT